jgi:hypothetical protein
LAVYSSFPGTSKRAEAETACALIRLAEVEVAFPKDEIAQATLKTSAE